MKDRFPTKVALRRHVRALLDSKDPLDPVFWHELARNHPFYRGKIQGRSVVEFEQVGTRDVSMKLSDGSRESLSWQKCIDGVFAASRKVLFARLSRARLMNAFRAEVHSQIETFRGLSVCRDNGNMRYADTAAWHVGHDYDHGTRFVEIVNDFVATEPTLPRAVISRRNARLVDRAVARRWRVFHRIHAVLRMERARDNLRGNRGFSARDGFCPSNVAAALPTAAPAAPAVESLRRACAVRLRDGGFAQVQAVLEGGFLSLNRLRVDATDPSRLLLGDAEEGDPAVSRDEVVAFGNIADLSSLREHKAAWRAVGLRLARCSATSADVFVRDDAATSVDVGDGEASDSEEDEPPARGDLKGYVSDGGFIVPDSAEDRFTLAEPDASDVVADVHDAVHAFEDWSPTTEKDRKRKAALASFAAKYARVDDNHQFANGTSVAYTRPPKRKRRRRRVVGDD
jgi:hypothetical protein